MTTDKLRAKFEAWYPDAIGDVQPFECYMKGYASRDAEVEALRTKAAMWDALCDDCDANDAQRNQCAKNAIADAIELGSGALRHQYDAAMREVE